MTPDVDGADDVLPHFLAKMVDIRLRELGLSRLAASKLGYVSRSTLSGLTDRVPTATTLANLDALLSWEPGSAQAALYGREPVAREQQTGSRRPTYDADAADNYPNLTRWIAARLRELNLSKVRFAEISDVGRSTLATLGRRGYTPTPQTLERIDTHLMWEPGSAMAALKGGVPVRRGPDPTPHPSLIPITAVKERLRTLSARLQRQTEAIARARDDVTEMQRHIDLLYDESHKFHHTAPPAADTDDHHDDVGPRPSTTSSPATRRSRRTGRKSDSLFPPPSTPGLDPVHTEHHVNGPFHV